MDKQSLAVVMAMSYAITDVRVHLSTLINLLVEKNIITAKEFDDMQKKCEISEGATALKEIKRLLDAAMKEGDEK